MYGNGQGVAQDYKLALAWYRKAADQGNANAQFNLGCMYEEGQGVAQDYKKALTWYRKAAAQGVEGAVQATSELEMKVAESPAPAAAPNFSPQSAESSCCARCSVAGAPGVELMKCASCKVVAYCSKECQKEHWRSHHKTTCTPL